MAQISALGCKDVLTTPAAQDVKVGADNFDGRQVNPETLPKAKQVWVSLITNCKGVAFEIVQGADSPSQAWRQLVQHYRASGVKEWRRLALDFYSMKMELGEHPRQFFLPVDRLIKEMERVGRPTLEKNCYEPLERFIGISHKHWNNGKIMGDKSVIIPLDIRNGVILTSKG